MTPNVSTPAPVSEEQKEPKEPEVKLKNWKPGGPYSILFYSLAVRPNSDYPKRASGIYLKYPGEAAYQIPVEMAAAATIQELRAKAHSVIDSYFDRLDKAMEKKDA